MRSNGVHWIGSAMILAALITSTTVAQTAPANGNGPVQPGFLDSGYRPSWYPETYFNDFPMRDVRAVPPVIMQSAMAGAVFRQSQTTLNVMILQMKKTFERTRDWIAAIDEEKQAWAHLEAARKDALQSVVHDSAYQASVALRDSLSEQIEQMRQQKNPNQTEILAMAQVKMGYAATASAMEAAAIAASPEVQEARERLRRASQRISDLRWQFDQSVRHHPDVQVARNNLVDARIKKVGLDAYREALIEAANFSVAYAYWYNRFNYYRYLNFGFYGCNPYPAYAFPVTDPWGR